MVGKDRSVISRIVQNTKFGKMHNFLEQGKDMAWIADHYHIDSREIDIAEKLGAIQQTINSWISDIRARHRASRKRASEIIGNTNFGNIDNLLSQGHDMDYMNILNRSGWAPILLIVPCLSEP